MINFHLGNNMDFMAKVPDKHYDLACVDPEYGIDINFNMGRRKGKPKKHKEKDWDKAPPHEDYFKELFRVSKNQIIWGGNYFPLPLTGAWIFWDKLVPDGVSFADGELAWTSFDKTLIKAKINYSGFRGAEGSRIHPTQKPAQLYKWIHKNYSKRGDLILDTHGGSMSHAIAVHQMNTGIEQMNLTLDIIEIDPDYYNAAIKRFKEMTIQATIF